MSLPETVYVAATNGRVAPSLGDMHAGPSFDLAIASIPLGDAVQEHVRPVCISTRRRCPPAGPDSRKPALSANIPQLQSLTKT